MNKRKVTAAALAAIVLLGGCTQKNDPAASETTTAVSLITTTTTTEQTTATTPAETTAPETSETTSETDPAPDEKELFTFENYGWVMNDTPGSIVNMISTAGNNMAFILHVDRAKLGPYDRNNEIVFYSFDADDMIYGEYVVNVKTAADPDLATIPSGEGEDIVAVPVLLKDILSAGDLDPEKISKFYITKNFDVIKKITVEPYTPPLKVEAEPEYDDMMIADMSERYYRYFTGNEPAYPNYEHFYTDDTVTSVYNETAPGEYGNTVTTIYTIDKRTAKGYDQNGNPLDLTQFRDGTPSDPDEPETYETGSFAYQRRMMKFENALFGVRFMGADAPGIDLNEKPEHLVDILNDTGTGEALGLYIGYPEENVVQTENGQWLYFIIPRSSDCKVEVKMDDDDGKTIYSGDGGPIILKCGSDYPDSSNCTVYITNPDGVTVSWRPELLADFDPVPAEEYGHINKYQIDGLIHDFSDYNNTYAMG